MGIIQITYAILICKHSQCACPSVPKLSKKKGPGG
jgi:hypothetical protein